MPSQYGEETVVDEVFAGHVGRFLDIGAGDGMTHSNTWDLFMRGWTGVVVEPGHAALEWLHGRPYCGRVDIVAAAIGLRTAIGVPFWEGVGPAARDFSTCSEDFKEMIRAHSGGSVEYLERSIIQLSWTDLLALHPGPYDFVNIDVEGLNLELLKDLPWLSINPQMVCIEIDPEDRLSDMHRVFEVVGLKFYKRVGGNLLAWRKFL